MVERLRIPLRIRKKEMVESYVQAKLGLTYKEFLDRHEQIDSSLRSTMFTRIHDMNIDAELLIVGYVPNMLAIGSLDPMSLIFRVIWEDVEQHQNFACIGAGAPAAEQVLHRREHHDYVDLGRTLYNVYEAKKFGELAPSVGARTNIAVVEPPTARNIGTMRVVSHAGLALLESYYQQYGPKTVSEIRLLPDKELFNP
jgi:hypothetical protein